jgi:hypothetical protein
VDQWLPLAFVPVLSPAAWLLSAPGLAGVLVQGGQSPLSINIRYAMAIVPPLFYGAVLWWAHHPAAIERPGLRRFWRGCIAVAAVTSLTSNPHQALSFLVPDSIRPWLYVPITRQWERARTLRGFVAQVPPEATVAASSRIVAPLSSRRGITRLPHWQIRDDAGDVRPVDYVIADVAGGRACASDFMDERPLAPGLVSRLQALVRGGQYGLRGFAGGVVLAQRAAPSDAAALDAWTAFLARCHPALAAGERGGGGRR